MGGTGLKRALLGVAVASITFGASEARAQDPPTYGGGLFRGTTDDKGYHPNVGVTFEQRGGSLALRFDTTLRCGRETYQVSGHKSVPAPGGHAEARGRESFGLTRGRVRFTWKLTVDLGPTAASGVLDIRGKRRGTESCTRKPRRSFQALLATPPTGTLAQPAAGALYRGLSSNRVRGGLRLPVLLRVEPGGKRVSARWSASARCGRGPPEPLINFTPVTTVRADGTFSRSERFKQLFTDTVVRYRVLFRGSFTSDGAAGTLRLRTRIYERSGRKRLLTSCDTDVQRWSALLLQGQATARPAALPDAA